MFKKIGLVCCLLFAGLVHAADDSFVISDIRVEGLQRVSAGNVFANLPFNINDTVQPGQLVQAIRMLFRSGNFNNIEIGRDGTVLVIRVQERPAIAEIEIEGNKAIKTEDLLDGLKRAGLAEGQVFKRATLESIRLELERQYVSQGRYDAAIVAEVEALERNRVALHIDVDEGTVAKIKHINIVGNQKFSTEELLDLFEMRKTHWMSWAKSDDKYARERMRGDLEKLESFYRDQGYLKFTIDSTQVALSPEKDAVFITINVSEGDVYNINEVKLSGDIILPEPLVRAMILLKPGESFSQSKVTYTEELISKALGNAGYTFAKVRSYPQINEADKTVELTFFVDPGKRTYVNRIEFVGNTTTEDEVLRREMRQMEAAPASGQRIEQSRVRLERLGFFKSVESEMVPVPGEDDQVDVTFHVEEQHSGSIGASIGYADGSGLVLSANLEQNNFMGSGNRASFGITKNDYQTRYNFSFTNPYYTVDGVSRGFSLFYKETDFDALGVAEYSSNSYGGTLTFGYPVSETARVGFGVGYSNIEIETGPYAPQEVIASPTPFEDLDTYISRLYVDGSVVYQGNESIVDLDDLLNDNIDPFLNTAEGFIDRHGHVFDSYTLTANWQQSKLNRGLMPTRGFSQSVGLELGIPGTDLEYYKMNYDGQFFVGLADEVSLRFHGTLGYGEGYGDTKELPFFEHYFAGGFGSVRGYERSSLGPKGTPAQTYLVDVLRDDEGNAVSITDTGYIYDSVAHKFVARDLSSNPRTFGGNVLVEAGAELIFPIWFVKDRRSLRTVLFLDSGNVFDTHCGPLQAECYDLDLGQLRASYGFGLTWISALGPLTFSLAEPFNNTSRDKTKFFQFSIGTGF